MSSNNDKIYTPKELNKELLDFTKIITNDYLNIKLKGDIVECKIWKYGGMSFKLMNNKDSFECKVWLRDGLTIESVVECENKNCTITGYLTAEYFYSHKFVLNIQQIELNEEKSKLSTFKEDCERKGLFKNKKNINWDKVNELGIISKSNTQGYNDFKKQFKIPLELKLEEITLEGKDTRRTCINAINNLQNVDLIIIIRGGGTTSEISNSFDNLDLFECIKNSNVPIITAIGHELDKGDKLLITEVSDLNYPTPSTAAIQINKIKLEPKIKKINLVKNEINNLINDRIYYEEEIIFNELKKIYENLSNKKFGAPIYKINNDFIIVEKDGKYYKNIINYDNPLDISIDDINIYKNIKNSIYNKDFMMFKENIKNIIKNDIDIEENINKLENLDKLKINYNKVKSKKLSTLYCKTYDINKLKTNKLIQLLSIYLFYEKVLLENIDENILKEIYDFL